MNPGLSAWAGSESCAGLGTAYHLWCKGSASRNYRVQGLLVEFAPVYPPQIRQSAQTGVSDGGIGKRGCRVVK
jgi:hypothetical protein